jgi:putative hydrolase of the HAD superfamily
VSAVGSVFCFDLDDTLVSEADAVESGLRAAGALLDAAVPGPEPAGEWLVATWRHTRARDVFQRLLARRGTEAGPWLQRLKNAYRAHTPVLRPRVGVPEVLSALIERGSRLALVTDGYLEVQRRKWAALSLAAPFDPVVFTDERGRACWKPHPWGFERVMEAHPSAGRFLYVADNPAKDFVAPNRLGWTTVMVRHESNLYSSTVVAEGGSPAVTIGSLAALLELG